MDKLTKALEQNLKQNQEKDLENHVPESALYSWPGHKKLVSITVWLPTEGVIEFKDDSPKEWYWYTNNGEPIGEGQTMTKELAIPGEIDEGITIFDDGEVLKFNEEGMDRDIVVYSPDNDGYFSLNNPQHKDKDKRY